MSHAHDEYIDYSCSTSVERLARDVETLLRKWHVADGSDRHVSFASSSSSHGGSSRVASRQTSRVGAVSDKSKNGDNSMEGSEGDTRKMSIRDDQMDLQDNHATCDDDNGAVRLIRSEDVTLASFPLPCPLHEGDHHKMIQTGFGIGSASNRVDVTLTLSLWDGPLRNLDNASSGENDENKPWSSSLPPLPLSLMDRYDPHGGVTPPSITSDLCALLGVGQHITLRPKEVAKDGSAPTDLNAEAAMLLQSVVLARVKSRPSTKNDKQGKRSKVKSALQVFNKDKGASSEDIWTICMDRRPCVRCSKQLSIWQYRHAIVASLRLAFGRRMILKNGEMVQMESPLVMNNFVFHCGLQGGGLRWRNRPTISKFQCQ